MIWFSQEFALAGQPQDATVRLEGTYNAPDTNLPRILVRLYVGNQDDTIIVRNLFEKNPAMLRYQEPESDDVYEKYQHNVQKLISKIDGMNYEELVSWCSTPA